MDGLAARIAARFETFVNGGAGQPVLRQILRDALAERRAVLPAARAAAPPPPSAPLQSPPVTARDRTTVTAPVPEAGLVTGLFASPQSLVAAFIVAEVLAKPVALRDR